MLASTNIQSIRSIQTQQQATNNKENEQQYISSGDKMDYYTIKYRKFRDVSTTQLMPINENKNMVNMPPVSAAAANNFISESNQNKFFGKNDLAKVKRTLDFEQQQKFTSYQPKSTEFLYQPNHDYHSKIDNDVALIAKNEYKTKLDKIDLIDVGTQIITKDYAKDIMKHLKKQDIESTPSFCLKNHSIPSSLRSKMIDWMIEVLCSYKCSTQTFFIASNIMDHYFLKAPHSHDVNDLHLIGVTSMYIATKYEEIYPLKLSVIHEKIAHRKLSMESIKKKEQEILGVLGYNIIKVTPYEFIKNCLNVMNLKHRILKKYFNYLERVCVYLSKMTIHDYDLLNQQSYSELAGSTLFVAFKIMEQVDKSFNVNEMLQEIKQILEVEEDIIIDCATRILSIAKNYDKLYNNLDNLKKFHSIDFDQADEQQQDLNNLTSQKDFKN